MTEFRDREYLGGYDLDVELFDKFVDEVEDVIPLRKVYVAKTNIGDIVLKKIDYSLSDLIFINSVIEYVNINGFKNIFSFMKSKNGELFVKWNNEIYCAMTYINGRECQFSNPVDLQIASKALAGFHKATLNFPVDFKVRDKRGSLINKFYHRINDLVSYKESVMKYRFKNEFDTIFLDNVDYYIKEIQKSISILENSNYLSLCSKEEACAVCHHDLAYHNIMIVGEEGYFVDLDYSIIDLRMHDLCNFMNKVMKECAFNIDIAKEILSDYNREMSNLHKPNDTFEEGNITKDEMKVLYGMLRFPEDFYSICKSYYDRDKNWEYELFLKKIVKKAGYREEREEFLEQFREKVLV